MHICKKCFGSCRKERWMINMYEPEKMSEDELMKLAYKRHQEVFEKWKYGKPVKA